MRYTDKNPREIVDQFLGKIGEPLSEDQSERAVSSVLETLHTDRTPALGFPMIASTPPSTQSGVWSAVAAAVVVLLAGGVLQILLQQSASAEVVARPVGGEIHATDKNAAFLKYSKIEAGRVVKAGRGGGAVVLLDGSKLDMGPQAELSVVRETDGLRVRLASGTVLVTAARQRKGNLYVETKDCVVTVTGTVFAVSAEASGSSVAVLEGEVQVQSGEVSRTLLAGEQTSTSAQLLPLPRQAEMAQATPDPVAVVQQPQPAAVAAPGSTSTVRGVVIGSSGVGIPDVTVALCSNGPAAEPAGTLPFEETISVGGPIVRNKTFFFAVFDAVARRCTPTTSVVTDSMGRFDFLNVAAGEYTVRAEREGFSASPRSVGSAIFRYFAGWNPSHAVRANPLSGDSKTVTVNPQQSIHEISLTLIRAGVIAGRVRDAEGRLLVNARVQVLTVPVPGTASDGINVLNTDTNDLGEYRAYWLLPGEYHVVAKANGRPYSDTWFSGGLTAADARTVVVREGETVPNIDITLRRIAAADVPPVEPPLPGVRR